MTIHIFFMFPETAGKSLEEIEKMFLSSVKAWETKVPPKNAPRTEMGENDVEGQASSGLKNSEINPESKDVGTTYKCESKPAASDKLHVRRSSTRHVSWQ